MDRRDKRDALGNIDGEMRGMNKHTKRRSINSLTLVNLQQYSSFSILFLLLRV